MSLTLHSMDAFCVVPKFLHLLFYSILLAHYTSLYISLYIILHVSPIVNQLNKGPSVILAWMISLFSVMALLHGELSNVSKLWHIDTLTCGEEQIIFHPKSSHISLCSQLQKFFVYYSLLHALPQLYPKFLLERCRTIRGKCEWLSSSQ